MITTSVTAQFASTSLRLDARYFNSPGVQATETLRLLREQGAEIVKLGGADGLGSVFHPNRFKRQIAQLTEESKPFLRAFDVFDYFPQAADYLSVERTSQIKQLVVEPGVILLTRSGRNLGPAVIVDSFISEFIPSDDLLRVRVDDSQVRYYVLAYLSTRTGQVLLTQNKTGAVIDHLSADQVADVPVAFVSADLTTRISGLMQQACAWREQARIALLQEIKDYEATLGTEDGSWHLPRGWTAMAKELSGRLDAAAHNPNVHTVREILRSAGGPLCREVASAFIPGRYTRYYVESDYGRPILSGRQLLQTNPINLKHISTRSLSYEKYELRDGMVAFGAEGRAEERLGTPVLISTDRAGWLANNHVMRILPHNGVQPGWLFLAFAVRQTIAQVKAFSCGSVVDAVSPRDLLTLTLPPIDEKRGARVTDAWEYFRLANELQQQAVDELEEALASSRSTSRSADFSFREQT